MAWGFTLVLTTSFKFPSLDKHDYANEKRRKTDSASSSFVYRRRRKMGHVCMFVIAMSLIRGGT